MKKCTKCKKEKALEFFRKDHRTSSGTYCLCLDCQRANQKRYSDKKKEGIIKAF